VVDDDGANRKFLKELLENVGFSVIEASSGKAALDLVHQENFDALISDIRMADMDGISMCRQIRSEPKLGNLLVIASSASVYEDDRHNAISSGFDDFVPKPVREADLFRVLATHLNLRWTRSSDTTIDNVSFGTSFANIQDAIDTPLYEAVPPPDKIQQLIIFAKRGDVMALRTEIEKLDSTNPAYRIFCERLTLVAAEFRMGAIQTILQEAAQKNNGASANRSSLG
jgi:CheY-like chemotaxis protein